MEQRVYVVTAIWDDEAKVWVAESDDVPGLVTEAATLDELQAKIRVLVPELLELNDQMPESDVMAVEIRGDYRHEERIIVRAA
jgi:predicted RNase H-like HicB family nuclease